MLETMVREDSFVNIEARKRRISVDTYNIICIFTFGMFYLLCRYAPKIKFFLLSRSCRLSEADCVILTKQNGDKIFVDISIYDSVDTALLKRYTKNGKCRVISTQLFRFIFDFSLGRFVAPPLPIKNLQNFEELYSQELIKDKETEKVELIEKNILYGKNITNMELPTPFQVIVKNTYSINFILNNICIVVWWFIDYRLYAALTATVILYEYMHENYNKIMYNLNLGKLVNKKYVKILRNGRFTKVDSREVYPGNLIYIEPKEEFPCDAAVIKGDVICNECLLTGETVPIYKSDVQKSVVYSGTSVMRSINTHPISKITKSDNLCKVKNLTTKNKAKTVSIKGNKDEKFENYAIGVVVGTGFQTVRGQILKTILNPKKQENRFVEEAVKMVLGINILAGIMALIMVYVFKVNEFTIMENFIYSLDLYFTLANPNLVTYLNLGGRFATKGLAKKGITCTNVNQIYLAGRVDTVVFDKTGTLTCEGLDLLGVDNLKEMVDEIHKCDIITRMGLSTCHMVYELDGKYSGDILDVKMFIFSSSKLVQHADNTRSVSVGCDNDLYGPILKEYGENNEKLYYQKYQEKNGKNDGSAYWSTTTDEEVTNDEVLESVVVLDIDKMKDDADNKIKESKVTPLNNNGDLYYDECGIKSTFCNTTRIKDIEKQEKDLIIIKTYDFDSVLRRMSVIVADGDKKYIFTKGSPESILSLLTEKPLGYDEKHKAYSLDGYRVIALAYREINDSVNRTIDESKLNFLSLIVFSNKLKPDTKKVISELNEANIKTIMCTGDNILTAISVGKECGIIENYMPVILFPVIQETARTVFDVDWVCIGEDEEFTFDKVKLRLYKGNDRDSFNEFVVACEGREFDFFRKSPQYFQFVLKKGAVFARFNPGQKKRLIEHLKEIDKTTMFCGDGANDTGALINADVGLALAQNEASLAAGFTSAEIFSVIDLIKEGRSALVTSVSRFKYILATWTLSYASLFSLIFRKLFLSDIQTVFCDFFTIIPLSVVLSYFKASKKIHMYRPNSFLLGKKDFIPFVIVILLEFAVISLCSLIGPPSPQITEKSLGATVVFFVSVYCFILNSIYFSDCYPHREKTTENKAFLVSLSLCTAATTFILIFIYIFPNIIEVWPISTFLFCPIGTFELGCIVVATLLNAFFLFGVQPFISSMIKVKNLDMDSDERDSESNNEE